MFEAETLKQGLDRSRNAQARPRHSRPRPARWRRRRLHPRLARLVGGAGDRALGARRTRPTRSGARRRRRRLPGQAVRRRRAAGARARGPAQEGRRTGSRKLSVFRFGDVEVDLVKRRGSQARRRSAPDRPSNTACFDDDRQRGRVLTHRQILREVWGPVVCRAGALRARAHGPSAPQARGRPGAAEASADRNRGRLQARPLSPHWDRAGRSVLAFRP